MPLFNFVISQYNLRMNGRWPWRPGTRRRLRASSGALAAAIVLTAAGCGSSSTRSTESASVLHYGKATTKAEAKATGFLVAAYFFDREGKDWPPACSYLSVEMKAKLERVGGPGDDGCGKGIEAMSAPASMAPGEGRIIEVKALRQKGGRAFLIYKTEAKKTDAVPMVMEEGEWKLASINPRHLFP